MSPHFLCNIYGARIALHDAGWDFVELDLHPDDLVPCETVMHKGQQRRHRLSCIFRVDSDATGTVYVCRDCIFHLHEHIGTPRFAEIVESARVDISSEGVGV